MKSGSRDSGRNAQLRRALQIIQELGRTGGMSLEQLAETAGFSTRTIRRDLGALREAGFVFASEQPDKQKLWKLDNQAQTQRLNRLLDAGHFLALTFAMKQGGPVRSTPTVFTALEDLSDKIEKALGAEGRKQLAAIDSCFYSYEKQAYAEAAPDVLWALVRAIDERRVCRVTYRKPQNDPEDERFEILPLRIFAHQGAAYVMCYVLKHASFATLNLHRVKKLQVLERQCEVPKGFDPNLLERAAFGVHTGAESTTYLLRFDAAVAPYIRERVWHPSQVITDLKGGDLEIQFACGKSWEVSAWVASWRHWVRVIEPASLRVELHELGATLLAQYENDGSPPSGHGRRAKSSN